MAMHHTADGNITTDMCMAAAPSSQIGFRVDANDIEIRASDASWNLPPNTEGEMVFYAGSYQHSFHSIEGGPKTLVAVISSDDAKQLISALETAPSATLMFGTKTKRTLSLAGSAKVLAAFQACARQSDLQDIETPAGPANTPF